MSSSSFTCIGSGNILGYLRNDLREAKNSVIVIGPWMDDYFAEEVVKVAPSTLDSRAIVRPEAQMDSETWNRTEAALHLFSEHWTSFEAKVLDKLHAKILCIDGKTAYVGSTNWYRYSLEKSHEVVLRGPVDHIRGFDVELEGLWEKGEYFRHQSRAKAKDKPIPRGIDHEVIDPLAAKVLKQNPGAWVLRRKE
jgi:phosphatidylserine/phosphatidylglycerophosphate/cardiolipin synthase-like enzyme